MSTFAILSTLGYLATVGLALRVRGRFYGIFLAVLLGVHTLLSIPLAHHAEARLPGSHWAFGYLQAVTFVHFVLLCWPRLRPRLYRVLVSGPASYFVASVMLGLPWAVSFTLGFELPWAFLPFVLGVVGLMQSLVTHMEAVDLVLDGRDSGPLSRHPRSAPDAVEGERPLRLVQITDPHLGPFMSPRRLQRLCQRAVDIEPDLVVLTGDFLTMESQFGVEPLAQGLAPLKALEGKTFACFGNHDHEAPDIVKLALSLAGVTLLMDEATCVQTPAGPVQIVGADYHFRKRREKLAALAARHPRQAGALRLWLLHDPGAFHHIPEGDADLVLSGHTHGGHLGLLSLGLPHTIVSAATRMPDHGLWSRGPDRLYVHRGTGHYGFPLRLGVPAEESLLRVYWTARPHEG